MHVSGSRSKSAFSACTRTGALVPRCLTSGQQVRQQETSVDWAFVSPVSPVSPVSLI